MTLPDSLLNNLPDAESAMQFMERLQESHARKLIKQPAILSDVLALVSHSPLLATTLLQNPDYIWWLKRRREDRGIRGKEELLESLARFSLTNSQLPTQVLFARFRRRELLRIFLADIRRQLTIAEITEEISNLADAVLETALRIARQELDNRYGAPLEVDDKGKTRPASFCIVSLGKLGSRELNYASDIDLLFIYSADGTRTSVRNPAEMRTSVRVPFTNREYFVKLAEKISKLVGEQTGEGATYRVDLRLRPHGRVGPLAMSVADTAKYYKTEAADWERQVLIRSRASAGDAEVFREFFDQVEEIVFAEDRSVESALRSVRLSKRKIDLEHGSDRGFDVKLGRGGIREIEFVAQALQLAYGGGDQWLRAGHTLISLSRLADRKLISETELTRLFEAYEFLRRLEHILQMEHGLQTHLVPNEPDKRRLVAMRVGCKSVEEFESALGKHSSNVNEIFQRVFSEETVTREDRPPIFSETEEGVTQPAAEVSSPAESSLNQTLYQLSETSSRFADLLLADVEAVSDIPDLSNAFPQRDYRQILSVAASQENTFRDEISALRKIWSRQMIGIIAFDALGKLSIKESKMEQTRLAEASIAVALEITEREMKRKYASRAVVNFAVMGLGKLGGAGIDYDSDLDLVLVYDDAADTKTRISHQEFYSRAGEIFVNALSSMTRDGSLYRVDLRLRPHGKNGPSVMSRTSFADYMQTKSAIWEMLAFVKIRAAGGDKDFAESVEREISRIVHERARSIAAGELAAETRRIRELLEKEKSAARRTGDIDVKYGPGGMLDIYFAIRFLQLRDNLPDYPQDRSSEFMLRVLRERGSLTQDDFENLHAGYKFLSEFDHNLRLAIGRSTLVPRSNPRALKNISQRMKAASLEELLGRLTIRLIDVRTAFDSVVAS